MARIGVLALQGDVSEHVLALERAGKGKVQVVEVRKSGQMEECAGPGAAGRREHNHSVAS